jgi:NifU-like protein involved in Fe-S cluster formation
MYMIVVLALVAVLGGGAFFFMNSTKEAASVPQPTPVVQEAMPDTAPVVTAAYKDGTYTQKGSYTSPAGAESVEVSVTLAGDVVTAATFKGEATNPGSVKNQAKFADGYTSLVVGKKIDEIALTVVNGSSLTPVGFMEALAKVKTEAKM